MFNIIVAREGGKVISKADIRNFYEKFTGLQGEELDKVQSVSDEFQRVFLDVLFVLKDSTV